MRVVSLARRLELKYGFKSAMAELDPEEKARAEAFNKLKTFRVTWLDGPRVKDQSILDWADKGNKGPEFELIRELIHLVKNLSINTSLSTSELYTDVQRALTVSKILKDHTIEAIQEAMILSLKGRLRKPDVNNIKERAMKIRTFLRMLDSAYDKVRGSLRHYLSSDERTMIDSVSSGGYEDQKPTALPDKEIDDFVTFYAPQAAAYGLDNRKFVGTIIADLKLRPLIERLIRSIKRGHQPAVGSEVISITDSLAEIERKLKTNLGLLEGGEDAEAYRQSIVAPEEAWSAQMQQAKQQKALELEENPEILSPDQVDELVQKRDEEHRQKQIEEDRKRLIRSEGSRLLKKLIKKRYL